MMCPLKRSTSSRQTIFEKMAKNDTSGYKMKKIMFSYFLFRHLYLRQHFGPVLHHQMIIHTALSKFFKDGARIFHLGFYFFDNLSIVAIQKLPDYFCRNFTGYI